MNAETIYDNGQPIGRCIAEMERVCFRFRPFQNQERFRDLMAQRFDEPDDLRQAVRESTA